MLLLDLCFCSDVFFFAPSNSSSLSLLYSPLSVLARRALSFARDSVARLFLRVCSNVLSKSAGGEAGESEETGGAEAMELLDNVTATTAATSTVAALSRRVPLCSYSPPSLAGAPTALFKGTKTSALDSAAEKMRDWGSGFGGWLVAPSGGDDGAENGDEARRRRSAAAAASSSSPSDLSFPSTLALPMAQRQSTHELAGKGQKAAVEARDAAFYAEYALFLSEAKGKNSGLTTTAATTAAAATTTATALLTRESVVAGRRVPLAKLFRVVQRLGGYSRVAEGKRAWRDVVRAFEVR